MASGKSGREDVYLLGGSQDRIFTKDIVVLHREIDGLFWDLFQKMHKNRRQKH